MTRMTPSEVVDLFRQQQRDYEDFASRSSGMSADSFHRVLADVSSGISGRFIGY